MITATVGLSGLSEIRGWRQGRVVRCPSDRTGKMRRRLASLRALVMGTVSSPRAGSCQDDAGKPVCRPGRPASLQTCRGSHRVGMAATASGAAPHHLSLSISNHRPSGQCWGVLAVFSRASHRAHCLGPGGRVDFHGMVGRNRRSWCAGAIERFPGQRSGLGRHVRWRSIRRRQVNHGGGAVEVSATGWGVAGDGGGNCKARCLR